MTNSTLEKVARALAEAMLGRPVEPAFITEPCTGGAAYVEAARAALQSLRQVDDETVEAMQKAYEEDFEYGVNDEDAALMFTAAIDHILTEGGEG